MTAKTIEDAILKLLQEAATGAYYVERYCGASGAVSGLQRWIGSVQLPAVAVLYNGAHRTGEDESGSVIQISAQFRIWIIADRYRGAEEAMIEPGGIYEILETLKGLLQGNRLGLMIDPLSWMDESEIGTEEQSARLVWGQTWETGWVG